MNITMYDVGPKLNQEVLTEIEKKINHKLPKEYKEFMLQYNGGAPVPSAFRIQWSGQEWAEGDEAGLLEYLFSIYDEPAVNFLKNYITYNGRIPKDTIAIANDPGGNVILLGTGESNEGKVYYWDHNHEIDEEEEEEPDYRNVGLIANSFNEFIDSLYDDEAGEA